MSVFKYLTSRQAIHDKKLSRTTIRSLKNQDLPFLLKPSNISIGKTDKIFASVWLDERRVLCGTKCNKLYVIDVVTKDRMPIPMLQGSQYSVMPLASAGVHDISINEHRTFLATNGENPNHLAIYSLPTLDPVLVGEHHTDWVFGTEWINDRLIATGSRDGTVAVWDVESISQNVSNKEVLFFASRGNVKLRPPVLSPKTSFKSPLNEDKIRDLLYNNNSGQLVALSPNAFLYVWDIETQKRLSTIHLPFEFENVCLAMHKEKGLYAIGSQSDVSFMDLRTDKNVKNIRTQDVGAGIRSVSFKDSLVTIGTGHGSVFFYDLNCDKFLRQSCGKPLSLRSGSGWLRKDSLVYEYFTEEDVDCFKNAIYTHCYDPTETKLFTAGGPLALVLYGNYAALWE